jgi:hypothetical protein
MGQIMAFWFWQRLCRARPVLWLWNECRKRSQAEATDDILSSLGKQNGNPGSPTSNSEFTNHIKSAFPWRVQDGTGSRRGFNANAGLVSQFLS